VILGPESEVETLKDDRQGLAPFPQIAARRHAEPEIGKLTVQVLRLL
jgi:hypothetical protein